MDNNTKRPFYSNRSIFLLSSDEDLTKYCKIENFQDSGKGGQKRNRKYSAVRLTHIETGISAECAEFREQNINRNKASMKLKHRIAMSLDGPQIANIRSIISLENPEYPLWVAFVLDGLHETLFEMEPLSKKLLLTKSKLIKLIYRDRELWNEVNEQRIKLGKHKLNL